MKFNGIMEDSTIRDSRRMSNTNLGKEQVLRELRSSPYALREHLLVSSHAALSGQAKSLRTAEGSGRSWRQSQVARCLSFCRRGLPRIQERFLGSWRRSVSIWACRTLCIPSCTWLITSNQSEQNETSLIIAVLENYDRGEDEQILRSSVQRKIRP